MPCPRNPPTQPPTQSTPTPPKLSLTRRPNPTQAAAAVVNAHGGAALAAACRKGHVDLSLWLVESCGADPRLCLPHNAAPVLSLVSRVANGRLPEFAAEPLLAALCGRTHAGPDLDSPRTPEGHTALSLACVHGLSRLARVLLLAGAEPYRYKRLALCNAWTAAMRGLGWQRRRRHRQEQEQEEEEEEGLDEAAATARAAAAAAAGRAACRGMIEETPRFMLLVKARGVRDAVSAAKTLWAQQQEQEQEEEQGQQQQQHPHPSPRPNRQGQRRQRRAAAAAAVAATPGLGCLRWRLAGAAGSGSSSSGGGGGSSVAYPRVEVKAGGGSGDSDERLAGVVKQIVGGGLVPDLWEELRLMLAV